MFSEVIDELEKEHKQDIRLFWSPQEEAWITESDKGVDAFADSIPDALRELATAIELHEELEET